MLFVTWTYCSPLRDTRNIFLQIWLLVIFTTLWWQNCSFLTFYFGKTNFINFYCFLNICSFALFGFQWSLASTTSFKVRWVGLDGLEPSTSRLSGARSNHLSYRPWWRWWDSNPWPPACRAGALPTELHPHGYILLGLISPWKLNNNLLFLLPNSLCPLGSLRIRTFTRHPWDISRSP